MRKAPFVILAIAALQGCAGVTLAAAAAHVDSSPLLATASQFLMLHAGAGIGVAAFGRTLANPGRLLLPICGALQFGVTLFASDMASRALGPGKLFPYAAPIGGSITILAWAGLAAWALFALSGKRDDAA